MTLCIDINDRMRCFDIRHALLAVRRRRIRDVLFQSFCFDLADGSTEPGTLQQIIRLSYREPGCNNDFIKRQLTFYIKFDDGEDITDFLDLSKSRRPGQEQKRVNVDFPVWMINSLDKEAKRLGVPRQSIIKVWIAERLQKQT